LERNEDVRVGGADHAAVAIAEGDAGEGDADVIQDAAEFVLGDHAADRLVHLLDELGRLLDPRAAAGPQVQAELAAIDPRERILAELRRETKCEETKDTK